MKELVKEVLVSFVAVFLTIITILIILNFTDLFDSEPILLELKVREIEERLILLEEKSNHYNQLNQ